jgi:thiamine monophosphate kinase
MALSGGEDFELVFAVRPRDVAGAALIAARLRVRLTEVGRVRRGRASGATSGFDHFR